MATPEHDPEKDSGFDLEQGIFSHLLELRSRLIKAIACVVIVLVLFGTSKLTKIGPDLGNAVRGFKKALGGEEDEKKAAASSEKLQADPPPAAGTANQEQRDSTGSKHAE